MEDYTLDQEVNEKVVGEPEKNEIEIKTEEPQANKNFSSKN